MPSLAKAIRALIYFSVLLGIVFLVQVYNILPSEVLTFVSVGWVLFVLDAALTFYRPRLSYYLAFVLALLALATSLPETAHYAFIAKGEILPSATFILGSAAQLLLVLLVPIFVIRTRRVRPDHGLVQGK